MSMDYYQEITLLPDAEVPLHFIWTKVYTQLHIALAEQNNRDGQVTVAVSFPEYKETSPGSKLRLFTNDKHKLEELDIARYMSRLTDYVHITSIRKIPVRRIKGYAVYKRHQPDASVENKAKRYARRHPETTVDEAMSFMKQKKETSRYPYVQLESLSSKNRFSLMIIRESCDREQEGPIGTYGLSSIQTVPEF